MPAPAVVGAYIAVSVGTVIAALAFKEFVYHPYIQPKVELWREEILAHHRARRMRRRGPDTKPFGASTAGGGPSPLVEMESLASGDTTAWATSTQTSLRQRKAHTTDDDVTKALEESITIIPHSPLTPTPLAPAAITSDSPTLSRSSTLSGTAITIPTSSQAPTSSNHSSPISHNGIPPIAITPHSDANPWSTSHSPRGETSSISPQYNGSASSPTNMSYHTAISLSQRAEMSRVESPFSDVLSLTLSRTDMVSPFSLADPSEVESMTESESASVSGDDLFWLGSPSTTTGSRPGSQSGDLPSVEHDDHHDEHDIFSDPGSDASWDHLSGPPSPRL